MPLPSQGPRLHHTTHHHCWSLQELVVAFFALFLYVSAYFQCVLVKNLIQFGEVDGVELIIPPTHCFLLVFFFLFYCWKIFNNFCREFQVIIEINEAFEKFNFKAGLRELGWGRNYKLRAKNLWIRVADTNNMLKTLHQNCKKRKNERGGSGKSGTFNEWTIFKNTITVCWPSMVHNTTEQNTNCPPSFILRWSQTETETWL